METKPMANDESGTKIRKALGGLVLAVLFCWNAQGQKLSRFVVTVPVQTYTATCHADRTIEYKQVAFPVLAPDRLWADQKALHTTVWTEAEWKHCERNGICEHIEWPDEMVKHGK